MLEDEARRLSRRSTSKLRRLVIGTVDRSAPRCRSGRRHNLAPTALFTVIIPARYASTRLPGKPLADIAGKPMVVHVAERARLAGAAAVVVATDDERIQRRSRRTASRRA